MKLKTTAFLATCGVLVSTAGAFAIPVTHTAVGPEPEATVTDTAGGWTQSRGPRITVGDTLLVDARLGHASLGRDDARIGETYLFAQVTARDAEASGSGGAAASPAPMNLAIVIDRSGSMKGERIANAMNAAVLAVERLRDGDTISVVAFDTSAQVVVHPTRLASGNRPSVEAAIRSIRLGGDTCISCGLEEGMRLLTQAGVAAGSSPSVTDRADRLDRIILLSDGATNAGVRDVPGLRAMAGRMHGRGTTISTIGVDVDFDEKVMAAIANEANGRHYFVANASGLPAVFSQEFDDLLSSVAKEAELTIDLAPGVEVAEVFDRSFRREGDKLVVPFGTFSAKQEKTVLVRLRVSTERDGEQPVADVKLTFRDLSSARGAESGEQGPRPEGRCDGTLVLAVKSDGSEQRDLDPFVAARVERSRTAQTLTEANKLFEAGRSGDARAKLAARKDELKKTESSTLAIAATAAPSAAPRRSTRALDRDFADQSAAVTEAEQAFAVAPASPAAKGAAGGPGQFAPAPPSRAEKAQVRSNQAKASEMGF